jgi:ligand-binding sensor domain-containing protein
VQDGLADKWVYSMVLDQDDVFWFGTEAGVSRFDRKSWTTYTHADGIGADVQPDDATAALFPSGTTPPGASSGEGGYGGSGAARHHMDLEKQNMGPNPNFIISAVVDRTNTKWFGTWGAGLTRYDGKHWTTFTKEQGLGGNFILALSVDPDGRIWAGTDGGASWFDGTVWHTITAAQGLPSNFIFSILFDERGHRWFGTLNGLSVFRGRLPA